MAAAGGSETCTKSSEVQGGGGDVAGVPKGVPFPPAEKEEQKFSQQAPTSSFSRILYLKNCTFKDHLNHFLPKSLSTIYQDKSTVFKRSASDFGT